MQRISISISGIRRFSVTSPSPSSASNHVTLAGKKAFSFLDSDQTFPRNYHHQSPLYKVSSFLVVDQRLLKQVLGSCKSQSNSKSVLLQAHAHILKLGYGTHPTLVASIVAAYRRCSLSHIARRLLTRFLSLSPGVSNTNLVIESLMINRECGLAKKLLRKASDRNVITWNLMIGGYVRNVQYEEALRTLKDMISFSDIKPNKFSFASALAACARLGDLNRAKWVHSLMMTDGGVELNPILCTALVDVYAKCGDIKSSREVFYGVERDDVSVWNAMITGFATHGLAEEAIRVFSEMEGGHVWPDSITFLGMLTACSHCGLLEEGKGYFDLMSQRYSIQPKLEHYGAMVDLLGRGGKVKEAYELIESMPVEPDLVIWRSLLSSSRTYKNPKLAETAIQNLSKARSGDYVLLSNIYSSTKKWESAQKENPDLWKWLTSQEQPPEIVSSNPVFLALHKKVMTNLNKHAAPETRAAAGQPWVKGWDDFKRGRDAPISGNQ
ncbi:hypothetical protein F2Q68_00008337 [Brassica cretica]|uniref:Pentacotripeptide-repeat region of PRORP domain-containing protein n=1 Tax=Brassica cretica TaxID=69181 RepID=A0A8S9L4R0_BRACR|nr:hypothetical protein F2Q68_00008337 [Brassica cretica]